MRFLNFVFVLDGGIFLTLLYSFPSWIIFRNEVIFEFQLSIYFLQCMFLVIILRLQENIFNSFDATDFRISAAISIFLGVQSFPQFLLFVFFLNMFPCFYIGIQNQKTYEPVSTQHFS